MIELIGESDDVVVGIGVVSRVSGEISAYAVRSKNITKKNKYLYSCFVVVPFWSTKTQYISYRQKYTQFCNVLIYFAYKSY